MNTLNIGIKLHPSIHLMIFILMMTGCCLLILCFLSISVEIKIILLIATLIYSTYLFFRYSLLKTSQSIVKILYHNEQWLLENHSGIFPVQLSGQTTITTWLTVLCFFSSQHKFLQSCLITRDMMDKESYRKLLVRLRTSKTLL